MTSRRNFIKQTGAAASLMSLTPFYILKEKPKLKEEVIGHGDFRYKVHREWGVLDSGKYPVNNCHEMVQDSLGRLIMLTDEAKNNVLIYDKSGRLLDSWTLGLKGAHGLSIHNEGGRIFCISRIQKVGKF